LNAQHRSAYDALAERYAVVNAEMPEAVTVSANRFLAALARGSEVASGSVLDLGCGAGRDMQWMEARQLEVVGADLSSGMLSQARRRVLGGLVSLDMRALPLASESFAGVWCNAALIHLPKEDVPGALAEVSRILVRGGTLFISIQVGSGETWEEESYDVAVRRFFARYTTAEFQGLMVSANFDVDSVWENCSGPHRHWAHYLATRS
jgi:ubiquinone/menaquinone biosynthesis C-methylase UbiE